MSIDSVYESSWTTMYEDVTKTFVRNKMECYSSNIVEIIPNQLVGYDPVSSQPIYEDVTATTQRTCEIR
jgi:hypothetical protein